MVDCALHALHEEVQAPSCYAPALSGSAALRKTWLFLSTELKVTAQRIPTDRTALHSTPVYIKYNYNQLVPFLREGHLHALERLGPLLISMHI